jgi:peptide chain release factor subunit 1
MDVGPITWELLRSLADEHPSPGPAVSLYLDLDPSTTPTWRDIETRATAMIGRLDDARAGLRHVERASLEEDIERIESYLRGRFDREGAAGLALFSSARAGLWRVLALPAPVSDEAHVDRELHLAPLVPLVPISEPALVAVVNRRRGSLYRVLDGTAEPVAELSDEDVPGRHDQGGWSQANYQRHIDELAQRHLAEVAAVLDRHYREEGRPPVVLVCPEDERSRVEDALPAEVASAVVGWTSIEAHASAPAVAQVVRPLLAVRREARVRDALEHWRAERAVSGRAACGWEHVLSDASAGRIDQLLYHRRAHATGFRCPSCLRAQAEAEPCPLDATPVEPVDAVNAAVLRTLRHGGTALALDDASALDGEAVCALRRW